MKILCVGCSFTDGVVDKQPLYQQTYPYILSKELQDCTVYNLGHKASDNLFSYIVISQAIQKIKPDIILRQITSPQRFFMYKVDEVVNLIDFVINIEDNYNSIDKKKLQHFADFHTPTTSAGKLHKPHTQNHIRDWNYKFYNQNLFGYQSDAYLRAGDELMKENNITNITFSWFSHNKYKECLSIEELVGLKNEYFCDPQGHFNFEGNTLVAKNIKQMILETK